MKIKTDSKGLNDPKDPDQDTIFALYSLFASPDQISTMRDQYQQGGYGYGHAKQALFELMDEYFAPFRETYQALQKDPDYVVQVLEEGEKKVRPLVEQVMHRCREACGFGPLYKY